MDIIEDVRQVVAKSLKLPIEKIQPDTPLQDVGANSLDVIEIVYELEEKFGIAISFKSDDSNLLVQAEKGGVKTGEVAFATVRDIANAVKLLVDAKTS
jgi:acyl carrier protein